MYISKEKADLLKLLNKRYLNKHIEKLEKKYKTISSGSHFLNKGITWHYYTLNGHSIVITTEYNTIKAIESAY